MSAWDKKKEELFKIMEEEPDLFEYGSFGSRMMFLLNTGITPRIYIWNENKEPRWIRVGLSFERISLEKVLEVAPDEIKTRLLFHLNVLDF